MEDITDTRKNRMCVNKKTILNRKYTMNKKNGGIVPPLNDIRQKYVETPCGQCYICRKKKGTRMENANSRRYKSE